MVKRQCAALEEQQLQALINAEAAEAQSVAAQHALQTAEMEAARTNGTLAAEHVQLKARLAELEAQRAGVEAAVLAEDRERYRHLRDIKKGRAVTPLADGVCAVCGVTPSEASVHAARLEDELVECGNCGRLLYIA
jgi:predicted  nucleic acid-binding Zn-ribbon protein